MVTTGYADNTRIRPPLHITTYSWWGTLRNLKVYCYIKNIQIILWFLYINTIPVFRVVLSLSFSLRVCMELHILGTSNKTSCWIKIGQLDVTCFIISLLNIQHVSNVNTSILRSLRLICRVISWVVLLWFDVCWCYGVVRLGWCGILMQAEAVLQPA